MSWGPKQTIQEGYNKFVIRNEKGCWDWKGCCSKNPGYGQFRSNMKLYRAHIASWIIHFGDIPEKMCVCHKCDNRRCSNPDHLFLGTVKENNLDALSKNRCPSIGKKRDENHSTKIFSDQINEIVEMTNQGYRQHHIAKKFNVSQSAISYAISKVAGGGLLARADS